MIDNFSVSRVERFNGGRDSGCGVGEADVADDMWCRCGPVAAYFIQCVRVSVDVVILKQR